MTENNPSCKKLKGCMEISGFGKTMRRISPVTVPSRLLQWPCQIGLMPVCAPYFENAELLIAADCAAYAYADFHNSFMLDRVTLIGCPHMGELGRLNDIIRNNHIKGITVVRMEVSCCDGLEAAITKAVSDSNQNIPIHTITISTDGNVIERAG